MNNFYHVTMVLRQNGRIEVYYNFEYIYSFDIMPEGLVCVDVDNDNDYFYLKYVTERNFKAKQMKDKYIIRKVAHHWRSRIKYNYT